MEGLVMVWLIGVTCMALGALWDIHRRPYDSMRYWLWLAAIMVVVFGFVFGVVAP